MLAYKPVDASCVSVIRPYFDYQCCRSCDYTVGVAYMWRDYFQSEYALQNDMLFMRMRYPDGVTYHLVPVGPGDRASALTALSPDEEGYLRFATVPGGALPLLEAAFGAPVQVFEERRWADYIYPRDQLATYAGKKMAGQRNHVNHFLKQYGGYAAEPLTPQNADAARTFLLSRQDELRKEDPVARAEYGYALDTLGHIEALGYTGLMLRLPDQTIVGLSMGETVRDTLYVHVEKALHSVQGASQMLCREYAASMPESVLYVNREDDMGDEGLRAAKLALHPCEILAKYTAIYHIH